MGPKLSCFFNTLVATQGIVSSVLLGSLVRCRSRLHCDSTAWRILIHEPLVDGLKPLACA